MSVVCTCVGMELITLCVDEVIRHCDKSIFACKGLIRAMNAIEEKFLAIHVYISI